MTKIQLLRKKGTRRGQGRPLLLLAIEGRWEDGGSLPLPAGHVWTQQDSHTLTSPFPALDGTHPLQTAQT